jgi:hypothetical protein
VRYPFFFGIEKISLEFFTFLVSKFDKSKVFNEEQRLNILLISVTLIVLNLDKFKEVKEEHLENI